MPEAGRTPRRSTRTARRRGAAGRCAGSRRHDDGQRSREHPAKKTSAFNQQRHSNSRLMTRCSASRAAGRDAEHEEVRAETAGAASGCVARHGQLAARTSRAPGRARSGSGWAGWARRGRGTASRPWRAASPALPGPDDHAARTRPAVERVDRRPGCERRCAGRPADERLDQRVAAKSSASIRSIFATSHGSRQ